LAADSAAGEELHHLSELRLVRDRRAVRRTGGNVVAEVGPCYTQLKPVDSEIGDLFRQLRLLVRRHVVEGLAELT